MKSLTVHLTDCVHGTYARQKTIFDVVSITISKADLDTVNMWRPVCTNEDPKGVLFKIRSATGVDTQVVLSAISWHGTNGGSNPLITEWCEWLQLIARNSDIDCEVHIMRYDDFMYTISFNSFMNGMAISKWEPMNGKRLSMSTTLVRQRKSLSESEQEFFMDSNSCLSDLPIVTESNSKSSLLDYSTEELVKAAISKNGQWCVTSVSFPNVNDFNSLQIIAEMMPRGFTPKYGIRKAEQVDPSILPERTVVEEWVLGDKLSYDKETYEIEKWSNMNQPHSIRVCRLTEIDPEDLKDCLTIPADLDDDDIRFTSTGYVVSTNPNKPVYLDFEKLLKEKKIHVVDAVTPRASTKTVMKSNGFEPIYYYTKNTLTGLSTSSVGGWRYVGCGEKTSKPEVKPKSETKTKTVKLGSFPKCVLDKYLEYEFTLDKYVLNLEKLMEGEDCLIGSGSAFSKNTSIEMIKKGYELYFDKSKEYCKKYNGSVKCEYGNTYVWVYDHKIEGEIG